jgi:Fe2+ or Zn2+ uptake regulation protein
LTESARDCLALLSQAREPLSAARVRRDLERHGVGIYGIATVKRALIKLLQLGLVGNSRKSPRGYYLIGPGPLFRRHAGP